VFSRFREDRKSVPGDARTCVPCFAVFDAAISRVEVCSSAVPHAISSDCMRTLRLVPKQLNMDQEGYWKFVCVKHIWAVLW
jgi:hypothetical protein